MPSPAIRRQLWFLRIIIVLMLAAAAVLLMSHRPLPLRIMAAGSSLMCAAVLFVVLKQAPKD